MNLAHATVPLDLYGKHYRPGEFLPFYVPRPEMPQVDEADTVRMIVDASRIPTLKERGAYRPLPKLIVADPRVLRAHQRIDHAMAATMDEAIRAKPIIVSTDDYVLDGNHRWWAHVKAGSRAVTAIRLPLPFDEAIPWLLARPYVYRLTPSTPERN